MPKYSGFVGPSYVSQSIVAADDRTVNLIPAKIESGTGAAEYVFDPAPGFSLLIDSSIGACGASYEVNRDCYMVLGQSLCHIQAFGTPAVTNIWNTGGVGPYSITGNGEAGHQVGVANGVGSLFVYDTVSHVVTTISSVGLIHVLAFMDGYFIGLNINTSSIFISALEDATSWDPLDVAQRNDSADKWRTMIVRSTELWLFGSESTSIYYNSGDPGFPFVPNRNIAIQRGIRATQSLALLQNSPIWLADDGTVRYAQGYTPVRVSTHAIEELIAQCRTTNDADAFTYNEKGHSFYVLNFPEGPGSGSLTVVYDLSTGLWHERGVNYNATTFTFDVMPVTYGVTATSSGGQLEPIQLVGSRRDGKIYKMSQAYATEIDGTTGITRLRRAPQIVSELNRVIYDRFQLFMEVGLATASGPGSAPTVLLQWSNDGGQTFNAGVSVSAGLHNAYNTRVIWRKLGQARQRVFQIVASDPIPWRFVDAFLWYRVGAS